MQPMINFRGLRHTWASQVVVNGVPLLVLAKTLGHSDTRMVGKHYGYLAASYRRRHPCRCAEIRVRSQSDSYDTAEVRGG
jgi:integrase